MSQLSRMIERTQDDLDCIAKDVIAQCESIKRSADRVIAQAKDGYSASDIDFMHGPVQTLLELRTKQRCLGEKLQQLRYLAENK